MCISGTNIYRIIYYIEIMPSYRCDICNYDTYRLPDIERHNRTKKHHKNVMDQKNIIVDKLLCAKTNNPPTIQPTSNKQDKKNSESMVCDMCGGTYSCYNSLWRHKKYYCGGAEVDRYITIKPTEITNNSTDSSQNVKPKKVKSTKSKQNNTNMITFMTDLQNELKEQREEMKEVKEQNKKLLDLASKNADVSITATKSTNKSMNMMAHAMKHWANAPPMKQLEGKEALKLITFENKSKHPIEDVVIHQFNSKTLYRFLGNVLIKEFKKEDEIDQSLWTTDSSRLCFIIKQIVGDKGGEKWIADKSGIEITKLLISPLVDRVTEMMSEYSNKLMDEIKKSDDSEQSKKAMEKMYDIGVVIRGIIKNDMNKDILKYIAPYFNINVKNVELQKV